ncbi:MAG: sarcosine oxidase subunit beta [Parasphingorhabdus sp.]|jgi:sarcosine oxidase subunit beta
MSLPRNADVVIIGAGISGLATALPLAKAGCNVVIVDKGEPWSDASGANAGTLSVQVKRREVLKITRDAIGLWQSMQDDYGIDVGFGQPGGLRVATNDIEVQRLEEAVIEQRQEGIEVELLSISETKTMAPWLGSQVKTASFCKQDSYSSPLIAGNAMVAGARNLGVRIESHTKVTAIHQPKNTSSNAYQIKTSNGDIYSDHIINAAGAWAGDIAAMIDCRIPVQVDVNMLTVTEAAPPIFDRVVTHAGGILSVKQYPNGTCLIGGGWQGSGSVESGKRDIHYERFIHNMRVAASVIPALSHLRITRTWSGFEAVAPDALPVIGALPGHDNAWVLACARGGYSQGPALGLMLSNMILSPDTATIDPQFSPLRFIQ